MLTNFNYQFGLYGNCCVNIGNFCIIDSDSTCFDKSAGF